MLPDLVENIVKLQNMATALNKLFACDDASYDCNDIFRYLLNDNGFLPCIKVTKNVSSIKKDNIIGNLSIMAQKEIYKSGKRA